MAGSTSSRNRFGQYVRTRAIPVNPGTSAQSAARSRLSAYAGTWRGLTQQQRDAWDALAATMPRTDSLGQTYYPTGFQVYVGANTLRDLMSLTPLVEAPAAPSWAENPTTAVAVDAGALNVTHGEINAEYDLLAFASPPRSAGRAYESDFRYLAKATVKTAGDWDLSSAYIAKFGAPPDGVRVHVKTVLVHTASGLRGPEWRGSAVWAN